MKKPVQSYPFQGNETFEPAAPVNRRAHQSLLRIVAILIGLCSLKPLLAQDTTPPTILSAGSVDGHHMDICFSEPIDPASAGTLPNYTVNNGASAVTAAALRSDGASVTVTVDPAVSGTFSVTVDNVTDLNGNPIAPGTSVEGICRGLAVQDIGDPSPPGDVFSCDGDLITVTAGGNDMWGTQDQFTFVYQQVSGDFDVKVRVESVQYVGNTWSKAGLMLRENLTPGSRNHHIVVEPLEGAGAYEMNLRDTPDGETAAWGYNTGIPYPNAWIRLQRLGDTVTAYRGTDGENWEFLSTTTASYPGTVLVGLCTTAQQGGGFLEATTAKYHSFTVTLPADPHVVSALPRNAARGDAPVVIQVRDGLEALDPDSVHLTVDAAPVTPSLSKAADVTTITYAPATLWPPGSTHSVQLAFAGEGSGLPQLYSYDFVISSYIGPNGHFYEVVLAPGITWEDAQALAEQMQFCGSSGHLATIANYDEDLYADNLLWEARFSSPESYIEELWVGGVQQSGSSSVYEGWSWVNNEGPIPGINGGSPYTNWRPGEPNDYGFTPDFEDGQEDHMSIGRSYGFGWNDEGWALVQVAGYLVEYDGMPLNVVVNPSRIQLNNAGQLSAQILSSAAISVDDIDFSSIRLGHAGTEAAPVSITRADQNSDGLADLLCLFRVQDAAIQCWDTQVILQARTTSGCPL